MRRRLIQAGLTLCAFFLGGCIEFQEQTMSYRYDAAVDELRIFQDYRGIFGADAEGDPGAPLSDEELEQLRSLLAGQHTFFFENWIFEYDRAAVKKARADLDDNVGREEGKIRDADVKSLKRLFDILLANVHVANGPFYLGKDGRLCGVQSVSVAKCSKLVAAINACTPAFLHSMKDSVDGEEHTDAELAAIAAFAENGVVMVELDGNAVTFRLPMSHAKYEETFGERAGDKERLKLMRDAGLSIRWADQIVTFSLGAKGDQITELTLPVSDSAYTPNVVGVAREGHVLKERFDPVEAAKTFLLRKGAGD